MRPIPAIITVIIIIILAALGYRIITNRPASTETNINITATTTPDNNVVIKEFKLLSSAFAASSTIPMEFTCEGTNTLPPLSWENAPTGTQSFALTMYDPDVPKQVRAAGFFDHWVLFNIPATTTSLNASSTIGIMGNNGSGKTGYTGPCPPTNYEPKEHRYIFTLYALDSMLNLTKGATRADIEKAVATRTLASTTLMGRYQKTK
jgi:Raf kinase inhibitor-like YbhB/YbcL family protein